MKFAVMLMTAWIASTFAPEARAETIEGEAHVTLQNAEYVRVELNGNLWENIEFEKDGKLLLIKGLDTSLERNNVVLIPRDDGLAPFELDVPQKSYKKVRKGRIYLLVSKHQVKFEARKVDAPPPEPGKPDAPAPAAPPAPAEDDL
jgi:hypothetical protein